MDIQSLLSSIFTKEVNVEHYLFSKFEVLDKKPIFLNEHAFEAYRKRKRSDRDHKATEWQKKQKKKRKHTLDIDWEALFQQQEKVKNTQELYIDELFEKYGEVEECVTPMVMKDTFTNQYPEKKDMCFHPSKFQIALLNHVFSERRRLKNQLGLFVIATGVGKTVLSIFDIEYFLFNRLQKKFLIGTSREPLCVLEKKQRLESFRFLFLVHTKAIAEESYAKYKNHFMSLTKKMKDRLHEEHFFCMPLQKRPHSWHAVRFAFCLFQSFDKIPESYLSSLTHIYIDEVHHLLAHTYRKVYDQLRSIPKKLYSMMGMTATLFHSQDPNGSILKAMFHKHIFVDFRWHVAKQMGFFPPVTFIEYHLNNNCLSYHQLFQRLPIEAKEEHTKQRAIQLFLKDLQDNMVSTEAFVQSPSMLLALLKRDAISAKKVLIFVKNVNIATTLAKACQSDEALSHLHIDALHYRVPNEKQRELFQSFQKGSLNWLISVDMLNEGYDVPHLDMIVLARPTASELIFQQQLGRGLRYSSSKTVVCDCTFNLRHRWKRLTQELPLHELWSFILNFWEVDHAMFPSIDNIVIE